jgi:hypothetical protein
VFEMKFCGRVVYTVYAARLPFVPWAEEGSHLRNSLYHTEAHLEGSRRDKI